MRSEWTGNQIPESVKGCTLRIKRKRHLEIILSRLRPPPNPKLRWEGYPLDPASAAEIAFMAGRIHNDIRGKRVIDLGCGSGILAISAALLGAREVVGVDIDGESIRAARENAEMVGVELDLVAGDIECIRGRFDTTLMNPPFGSWRRGMDVKFLRKALEVSDVVYSLHKRSRSVREFLKEKIESMDGVITGVYEIDLVIPRIYEFHRRRRYRVKADLYRILKVKSDYGKINIGGAHPFKLV